MNPQVKMSFQSVPSVSTTFPCWVSLAGTLDCFSRGNEKVLLSGIVWTPIRYVTLETSAAQLRSVTEMAPRSPFSCVNRCPIRYDFRAGVTFSLKRETAMQISWSKGKICMRREFSSHRIFLGSLTWSPFYCFGKLTHGRGDFMWMKWININWDITGPQKKGVLRKGTVWLDSILHAESPCHQDWSHFLGE